RSSTRASGLIIIRLPPELEPMTIFQTAISIIATVVLFLHGLQGFSKEFQEAGAGAFQTLLAKLTKTRYRGFALGAFVTALIQSSSAVSSITVALVDAGAKIGRAHV